MTTRALAEEEERFRGMLRKLRRLHRWRKFIPDFDRRFSEGAERVQRQQRLVDQLRDVARKQFYFENM